jgi:hypothetical protein
LKVNKEGRYFLNKIFFICYFLGAFKATPACLGLWNIMYCFGVSITLNPFLIHYDLFLLLQLWLFIIWGVLVLWWRMSGFSIYFQQFVEVERNRPTLNCKDIWSRCLVHPSENITTVPVGKGLWMIFFH